MPNREIAVQKTSFEVAGSHLAHAKEQFGQTVTRMADVFDLGLVIADYELTIAPNMSYYQNTREEFLQLLTTTRFMDNGSEVVADGKTISIFHKALKTHFFVFNGGGAGCLIYYHLNRRGDESDDDFAVSVTVAAKGTKPIREVVQFKACNESDVKALALAMNLEVVGGIRGVMIKVPECHPMYLY